MALLKLILLLDVVIVGCSPASFVNKLLRHYNLILNSNSKLSQGLITSGSQLHDHISKLFL